MSNHQFQRYSNVMVHCHEHNFNLNRILIIKVDFSYETEMADKNIIYQLLLKLVLKWAINHVDPTKFNFNIFRHISRLYVHRPLFRPLTFMLKQSIYK